MKLSVCTLQKDDISSKKGLCQGQNRLKQVLFCCNVAAAVLLKLKELDFNDLLREVRCIRKGGSGSVYDTLAVAAQSKWEDKQSKWTALDSQKQRDK